MTRRGSATGTSGRALPGPGSTMVDADADQTDRDAKKSGPEGYGSSLSSLRERVAAKRQDQASPEKTDETADPKADMTRAERRAAQKAARQLKGDFDNYPHLLAIKPKEKYVFRSDYFEIDGFYASILGFFHDDAARDDFGSFWGINRIPSGLDEKVTVVVMEQVRRLGEKWIDDHIKTAERLDKLNEGEQATTGTASSRRKAAKVTDDMDIVSGEIQDGASYLHVHNRLLVKAPTLASLDDSIERITRLYIDRFATLKIAAYPGEQRPELTKVFGKNEKKRGKGFHFTSMEFAGSHSLVTNGLNDPTGEYVGYMVGDVNNSAVLFDANDYGHHVVVADGTLNPILNRAHVPDMWGSKLSQSCLLNNGKVVHLVLDGADLDRLGPTLNGLTARLDMNSGDINMFEMFGDEADELSIFPAHLEKIVLMAEQAYETTEDDRSVIRGSLKETLTTFYIDKGMWYRNAKENRRRLRVVNIPHEDLPRLQDIVTYFDTQYKALANSTARDDEALHAYNILRLVFKDLLDNNGDLFNTRTNDEIDGVQDARRVLYDFSRLMRRGKGVAMAQLVNTVGFAVDNLALGDSVIIHGAEHIDGRVKEYINTQFEHLFARGGRVVYLYNDPDKMLADSQFNRFDAADYTVLGPMRDATVAEYQKQLHQEIPPDLERLVTTKGENLAYLRRGHTNVVFHLDLALGINPARAARRDELLGAGGKSRPGRSATLADARTEEREKRVAENGAQVRAGLKPSTKPRKRLSVNGEPASTSTNPASPRRTPRNR